ncbi:MAG: hypothetical protein GY801_36875, partial [bacterium]|nr:hypothetical protein [bacterium]
MLKQTQNYPFEVGYIGGGNALLLFREEKKARKFVEKWTARLLVETPGITTAVAFLNVNRDELEHHFDDVIKTLHDVLEENQAKYSPQTVLPRHGITAECPRSEQSVEFWNDFVPEEERGYVSSVTYAKLRAAKPAGEELEKKYGDLLKEIYTFTDDIGKLGQKHDEDSHIAIVHIDGNAMSQRFQAITSLQEIRDLSKTVQDATENAFRVL